MEIRSSLQTAFDLLRPNRYGLKAYTLKDGKSHPFALILPGGGYQMVCSASEGAPIARALNRKGYHAFVVYYRCKDRAKFPAPMEDVRRAIQEIMDRAQKWHVEINSYSLWGFSAGGHLASYMGLTEEGLSGAGMPSPCAVILSYPVVTMGQLTHLESRNTLLGENPDSNMIERTSVEKNVSADAPPVYLWYGTADTVVNPENSEMLASALRQKKIPFVLRTYSDVGHGAGLGYGTNCQEWFDEAVSFWQNHMNK